MDGVDYEETSAQVIYCLIMFDVISFIVGKLTSVAWLVNHA